jgi:hypothetical protein
MAEAADRLEVGELLMPEAGVDKRQPVLPLDQQGVCLRKCDNMQAFDHCFTAMCKAPAQLTLQCSEPIVPTSHGPSKKLLALSPGTWLIYGRRPPPEVRNPPLAALQDRSYERAESARKRTLAEGVGCARTTVRSSPFASEA